MYLDLDEADIYGLAANVGARLQTLAEPGTVVISEEVRRLVANRFDVEAGEPQLVKGVDEPLAYFRVRGVRPGPASRRATPLVERDDQLTRLRQAWTVTVGRSAGAPRRSSSAPTPASEKRAWHVLSPARCGGPATGWSSCRGPRSTLMSACTRSGT